ncbi:MAG: acyl-CoA desaturase [Flavobacteriales bacterium]|nr:acyl-CoA desaturase [Flavobacteriales bacterium]
MQKVEMKESVDESKFQRVVFDRGSGKSFQKEVNRKVNDYFRKNNIPTTANTHMVIKSAIIIAGWAGTYGLILFSGWEPWILLSLALLHGFFMAMLGLNVGHDAIHGSYSKIPWVNKMLGLSFNLVGANDYVWSISHNIVHHSYTNIPDHDEDLNQPSFLRIEPTQKLRKIHRFQHVYAYFLYGLATIMWVFVKDYKKFFQRKLGGHYRKTFPRKEIFRLFFYKILYYFLFLALPMVLIDLPWYSILGGFFLAHFVGGFIMAVIFMLAHIVEETSYPLPTVDGKVNLTWADLQMYTTCNFAVDNKLVNNLFGGLNFQIEHHLFPKVCHIHYPAIHNMVRETAREHGLPYLEHPTFFGAVSSHTRALRKFGKVA